MKPEDVAYKEAQARACQSLWSEVVLRVAKTETPEEFISWVASPDGRLVVELAGLSPNYIHEQFIKAGKVFADLGYNRRTGSALARPWFVNMTDKLYSSFGNAAGGKSYVSIACITLDDAEACADLARQCKEMRLVAIAREPRKRRHRGDHLRLINFEDIDATLFGRTWLTAKN